MVFERFEVLSCYSLCNKNRWSLWLWIAGMGQTRNHTFAGYGNMYSQSHHVINWFQIASMQLNPLVSLFLAQYHIMLRAYHNPIHYHQIQYLSKWGLQDHSITSPRRVSEKEAPTPASHRRGAWTSAIELVNIWTPDERVADSTKDEGGTTPALVDELIRAVLARIEGAAPEGLFVVRTGIRLVGTFELVIGVVFLVGCAVSAGVTGWGVLAGEPWCTVVTCEVLVCVRNNAVGKAEISQADDLAHVRAASLGFKAEFGFWEHARSRSWYP